ncbi:MAG: multidrug ABC transporter ATP-binding protein, partial [Woeseiaceae bacterium]
KQLVLQLQEPLHSIPEALGGYSLELNENGCELIYTYDSQAARTGITALLGELNNAGVKFTDVNTTQSSLEEIFVSLVKRSV